MLLTIKRPTRNLFMPLIERFEKRLGGCQSKLISRGGRLQLLNSVLSTIPIYYMACFKLPMWVIKCMDQIRRRFLWGRSDRVTKGISLINWKTVSIPRKCGGLGVVDLQIRNTSLLLRWWWRVYNIQTLFGRTQFLSFGQEGLLLRV